MPGPSDRTRRFIAAVAADQDSVDAIIATMARTEIELVITSGDRASEVTAALTAMLLLRLEDAAPKLFLRAPSTRFGKLPLLGDGDLFTALAEAHSGFRALARFRRGPAPAPDLRLIIGTDKADGLLVGSAGWACGLGADLPARPGNPMAASFAAVLAASEALRVALRRAGSRASMRPFRGRVSLWDYGFEPTLGPDIGSPVDLDCFGIVGCGGVASATAWTLGLLSLEGTPLVADPDVIDPEGTNLNRHLTATFRHLGHSKADLLGRVLVEAGATPKIRSCRWDAVSAKERMAVEVGVISVDRDEVRRDFQLEMPRVILNAGTSDTGYYRVTYHDFLTGACLRCISRGDERPGGQIASAARRLGISVDDLNSLVAQDASMSDDALRGLTVAERSLFSGVRGSALVETVCAKLQPLPDEPAVSAPMLAAAPGVLLAAEMVKKSLDADAPLSSSLDVVACNILKGPHSRWVSTIEKREGCECGDSIYREHFEKKWTKRAGGEFDPLPLGSRPRRHP